MPKSTNQKEQILQAALRLFASRGYASTPISLIASTAKVSQGLMYNFFRSKEELLKELMSRGLQDIRESMTGYLTEYDPRLAIELHIRKTCEIIIAHKEFWRLLHAIRLQGQVLGSMRTTFRRVVVETTSVFATAFKKLNYPKPKLEALLFLAQVDGLVILFLQDEKVPIEKLAAQLIKRYSK